MRTISRTLVFAGLLVVASSAAAQAQAPVYEAAELTERPQLLSPGKTADLIRSAYTSDPRAAGVSGTVQLSFIIDESGKVDAGSVKVVAATAEALTGAALKVAPKLEFKPGKKDAKPVRTQVVLPLTFR